MIQFHIQATIYYNHSQDEVQELAQAIRPLFDHIRPVATDLELTQMRAILYGNRFRACEVKRVTHMLLRAANHARHHLPEYFPVMRGDVIAQAEALEDAVKRYANRFKALRDETIPVH